MGLACVLTWMLATWATSNVQYIIHCALFEVGTKSKSKECCYFCDFFRLVFVKFWRLYDVSNYGFSHKM